MSRKNMFKRYKLYYQESGRDTPFLAGYRSDQYLPELEYDPYLDGLYGNDL